MTRIAHLNIEVTRRCNQRCIYCFNDSGAHGADSRFLPAKWIQMLLALRRFGLSSVHVTGGEPFVWAGTIDLLAGAQQHGFLTSILSNGYRIPRLIVQHRRLFQELAVAQISLDSMRPEVHDARRGRLGAWAQAVAAIDALRALGVAVEISCTLNDENLPDVVPLAKYSRDIGARMIVRPMVPIGRASSGALGLYRPCVEGVRTLLAQGAVPCDVMTSDRFAYVPQLDDRITAQDHAGIATVDPESRFREGPVQLPGLSPVTHAVRLVEAA
jgi:MoaA/NifB/PqqE/SkfB family radical SAM enzyme